VLAVDAQRAEDVKDPMNFPNVKPAVIHEWPASNLKHKNDWGDTYVGTEGVKDNGRVRDGFGIYKWENKEGSNHRFSGDYYEGEYANDKRNG